VAVRAYGAGVSSPENAVRAALATAGQLGLAAHDATVLQHSNAVTARLLPCDTVARVSPADRQVAAFEVDLARRLTADGSPVGALDPRVPPRVYRRDGFVITLWTYYASAPPAELSPAGYAAALHRLHAGLRTVDLPTPHVTDRVEHAERLVASRADTPELTGADRALLGDTLRRLRSTVGGRGAAEQLLHGEPHPGNLLVTRDGPRFIDLETVCRGPVEWDLAHAPAEVAEHYPGADRDLLRDCRILSLALATTWRWDRTDRLPDGRRLGVEWLAEIRAAVTRR